ncbi:50S ribosomal protein L4 [bacterium]|nr:50S ribosomal protein L4 [bacterium]
MQVTIYKNDGIQGSETVQLAENIFGIEPNEHVVYQAVRTQLANLRQGTHSTKERGEVSGGGKKPWKQKGRGGARAGSNRSPLWRGGGIVFGPKPHLYKMTLSKKVKRLAKLSALSLKAKDSKVLVIEDLNFDVPKTSHLAGILKNMNLDSSKVLFLTSDVKRSLHQSSTNIPYVGVEQAKIVSTYAIMKTKFLVIEKSALNVLEEVLG